MDTGNGFVEPNAVIDQLNIVPGSTVADLGAGVGHFAVALSRRTGDRGTVYAVDIQKNLIETMQREARQAGRGNIQIIWGDLERLGGTKLRDSSCDMTLIINTLFMIQDKDVFAKEVNRILKPGGKVIVIDWTDSFGGMGPAAGHVVTKKQIRVLFENVGLRFDREFTTGSHHFGMIFIK